MLADAGWSSSISTTRCSRGWWPRWARRALDQAARGGGAVPLRLRLRRRGAEGDRRDRPGPAAAGPDAVVPLADARGVYVARTYAYVAAGREGLAIVDVEEPEAAEARQMYTPAGSLNDAHDVKVGMTNASLFAYVADGGTGCACSSSPRPRTRRPTGLQPPPAPRLIATAKTRGPALAVSKGLDRDRAVDEPGTRSPCSAAGARGRST